MKIPRTSWPRRWRERVIAIGGLASRHQAHLHHNEATYHRTVVDTLTRAGLDVPLYPFGAAANASLLYVITRAVLTLPIASVCELGAGQSTVLLDRLATLRPNLRITTLEQSEFWAQTIQDQVRHTITVAPLTTTTVRNRASRFYDPATYAARRYDCLIVDGPDGSPRYSRWGSVDVIDRCLNDEFLIVFDDAERRGELDTCDEALRLLESKGIDVSVALVQAQKSQVILASGGYRGACYF